MRRENIVRNPVDIYNRPDEVLKDASLSRRQKLEILQRWEYDARELEVAEEENMKGGSPSLLRDIRMALIGLESGSAEHVSATKQG